MRLGIVTGLRAEAEVLHAAIRQVAGDPNVMVRCAGANASRARSHADALIGSGARALLSFGVAGALDPALKPGALIAPRRIRGADGTELSCDSTWHRTLMSHVGPHQTAHVVDMAFSDTLVSSVAEKQALLDVTKAGAIDMESLAVARAANAAGVPFLILRAIADPASRAPPPAALNAVAPDGGIRYAAAIATLLRNPASVPVYLRLGRDNRAALTALRRVAALAAPFFGLV